MAGSRPLTPAEERRLVRHIRKINFRNRALIAAQLFLGFRISEVLALTIGHVLHEGAIRPRIALPPRFLKGAYGHTRAVPVGPELQRSLALYLGRRRQALHRDAPLFLSRQQNGLGPQALCRSSAEKIIKHALRAIYPDPLGLSSHTLRKTFAQRLYEASGHDLIVVRDGLGHASVAATQRYLATTRARVEELILQSDWTRPSRPSRQAQRQLLPLLRSKFGAKPRRAA